MLSRAFGELKQALTRSSLSMSQCMLQWHVLDGQAKWMGKESPRTIRSAFIVRLLLTSKIECPSWPLRGECKLWAGMEVPAHHNR